MAVLLLTAGALCWWMLPLPAAAVGLPLLLAGILLALRSTT